MGTPNTFNPPLPGVVNPRSRRENVKTWCTSKTLSGIDTTCTSSRQMKILSFGCNRPCAVSNAAYCPKADNMGMRGSPCSPPCDVLGDPNSSSITGRGPVKHAHKREDLISTFHPQQALKYRTVGDQIVRPNPIMEVTVTTPSRPHQVCSKPSTGPT